MFDPLPNSTAMTLTEVLGWVREISIIGFIVGIAWKLRGVWDDAKCFLERIDVHMTKMEEFAETVVTNHLTHIEKSLEKLAKARGETTIVVKHGPADEQDDQN